MLWKHFGRWADGQCVCSIPRDMCVLAIQRKISIDGKLVSLSLAAVAIDSDFDWNPSTDSERRLVIGIWHWTAVTVTDRHSSRHSHVHPSWTHFKVYHSAECTQDWLDKSSKQTNYLWKLKSWTQPNHLNMREKKKNKRKPFFIIRCISQHFHFNKFNILRYCSVWTRPASSFNASNFCLFITKRHHGRAPFANKERCKKISDTERKIWWRAERERRAEGEGHTMRSKRIEMVLFISFPINTNVC